MITRQNRDRPKNAQIPRASRHPEQATTRTTQESDPRPNIQRTVTITENQIPKAINHIKYGSKKKHCPVKIFNCLQNNGASNYDHDSAANKTQELMENGSINQNYKIIDPVTEAPNLPPDDEIEIYSEISGSNDLDSQPSQISSSNITPIVNVATTPTLNTAKTPKHHSDDIETLIKSLEDKLLSKIAALQSHFFNDIFDLRKDITLFKENNEKAKPADLNNKKD